MKEEDVIALLALQHTPNVGDITAKKLIAHYGSPAAIYHEKKHKIARIGGVGNVILQHLFDPIHREAAEKEWQYIQDHHIRYYTFFDNDYPANLKQIIDAPILFFSRGNIDLAGKKIISIVGTRQATSYGSAFCEKFVEELSHMEDLVIVSGFAYGVDIIAHKAAIRHGLQTVACLAHGLDTLYPASHKKYANQVEACGGFITEFWHQSKFDRKNFIGRNRIIAGLSDATIVIESALKGGSLVTADMAFSYDREVFAIPGRADDIYSQGCNRLIKTDKARLITSAADLIYYMGWEVAKSSPKVITPELFVELSPEEETIAASLREQGKQTLDDLAKDCGMPVHKLSNLLFQMEMKGVVRPLPGKQFTMC
jgi:DNA protecting protein dprA